MRARVCASLFFFFFFSSVRPPQISKYGRDFGFAEEACYPYEGADSACAPKPTAECSPQRWHADEYYYIGGFYGQSTEQLMKEELMANGPISVSFMVSHQPAAQVDAGHWPVAVPPAEPLLPAWSGPRRL